MMYKCNAWELWRTQNLFAEILVVVNLNPMEGLPVVNHEIKWNVSVFFCEDDLTERIGVMGECDMALITREYLRIRKLDWLIREVVQ